MAEQDTVKFAKLMPAEPPSPAATAAHPGKKDYCFDLKLGESNDETYPEFSWKELIKETQRKEVLGKVDSGKPTLNPYATDDEDDLKAMAARFEEKYKNGNETNSKVKKRKRRAEDYIDRGAGYDDNDSFIDNSDIYDEIVPEDIQPVYGGFYINSGRLDFKEAEVDDADVEEEIEEQRQTKGNVLSKRSADIPKPIISLKVPGIKKRRISIPSDQSGGKPSKITSRKESSSPKGVTTSASNSPTHPTTKCIPPTVTFTSSDSSSSDSSDTSTSASSTVGSESEKVTTRVTTTEDVTVKPKNALPQPAVPNSSTNSFLSTNQNQRRSSSAPVNERRDSLVPILNPPQRRLKVKNVPLNPKLHANSSVPTNLTQVSGNSPKDLSPLSNREIFVPRKTSASPGLKIPTTLSTTSILSATIPSPSTSAGTLTVTDVSSLPKKPNYSEKRVKMNPPVKRRVTDKQKQRPVVVQITPAPIVKSNNLPSAEVSVVSSVNRIQPTAITSGTEGKNIKKPRKPRAPSLLKNSQSPSNTNPSTIGAMLTPEQQLQAFQHLQFQAHLSSLGLSHLLQPLASLQPIAKEQTVTKKRSNSIPAKRHIPVESVPTKKNLVSFQNQIGSNVTVTEVRKTKPHSISPSIGIATISPRSNTPPSHSRINTPSPINIPRLPIPSSITVTPSHVKTQRSLSATPPMITNHTQLPQFSPNFQPHSNKTFTQFDVNALLSPKFNNRNLNNK